MQVGTSVSFAVTAGQLYRIAVEGVAGGDLPATGGFGLEVAQTAPLVSTVSIANSTSVEGNSGIHSMPFTVKLSQASAAPVKVTYTTAGVANRGTLVFAAGQTTRTLNVIRHR